MNATCPSSRVRERNIADNAIVVAFADMKGLYSKNNGKKRTLLNCN